MDTGSEHDQEEREDPTLQIQLDRFAGRTAVAVHGEELSAGDTAGWVVPKRRAPQQREAPQQSTTGESAVKVSKPTTNRAQFARRVNATLTKAARMPANIPRSEHKVIVRPRGGLHTGRVEAPVLMAAVMAATGTTREEAMQDTICANVMQNIIVVSTPDEQRAVRYAQLRALNIGGQTHEVSAYHAAPDGTAKGVIRNISTEDTPEEIKANVVNNRNPTAVDAHRIGNSTAVIVLFQGTKVPTTVKYGAVLVRCSLYRQHHEVCRQCGKIGHRTDVCPQPNARVCFACGKANPGANHDNECTPRCKLCGGPHPTSSPGCTNKYKTPYLVKKRQWDRRKVTSPQRERIPRKDDASFPRLSHQQQRGRSRSCSRRRRSASSGARSARIRSASRGRSGRSDSRRRPVASHSRERVAWTDIVSAPATRARSKTPRREREKSTQRPEAMQALREEITTLKAENARLNQQLKEVIRLLNNQQQQRQQAPPQAQAQPARQQPRVRTPPPPPPPQRQQQRPPATTKPERPAQQPRDRPVNPQPLETDMLEDEEEEGNAADPRSRDDTPEPQSRSGIGDAVRLRRYTEKQDKLEKRVNALEHRMNTRFTAIEDRLEAVEVTLQKMQEFLYKKLGRNDDEDNRDPPAQPQTSIWPGPQQQQAQA